MKNSILGLLCKSGNLTLKPLKKSHYKSFCDFLFEYDKSEMTLSGFLEMQASKEFAFFSEGKLWLYLFENKSGNKFESGEILGYCEITQQGNDEAEIGYYIKPKSRSCGNGGKMLHMAKEICQNMEIKMLKAKVECDNANSISILKSASFEFINTSEGVHLAELKLEKGE